MTTATPLKALVTFAETMDTWTQLIDTGELPDHGLTRDDHLSSQQPEGLVVYTFPTAHLDGVLRDLDIVLTRLGQPAPVPVD